MRYRGAWTAGYSTPKSPTSTTDRLAHAPGWVQETQQQWRTEMERNPVLFFMQTLQPAVDQCREVLADFVGADVDGLVFVPNATSGINTVLRSIEPQLGRGVGIRVTDHTYNVCRNVAEVAALCSGATLVEVPVPFPIATPMSSPRPC
jgi:isopenicillin-N epimerase